MPVAETNPKVYISYSWTTPDHEEWVLQLATDLRDNGVATILDKWHLKEGDDAHRFMERMVNDAGITKVILICDKEYVSKADDRTGGVGTETQIITPEIYGQQSQNKFVVVVKDRDQDGSPYVPAFYGSRIFIDFSDLAKRSEKFEQLLRWIFDRPLHEEPPIGNVPDFLKNNNSVATLATASQFGRAKSAIENNLDHKFVLIGDFFAALSAEFDKLRIQYESVDEFDELVIKSIESFLPYRNQVLQIFLLLARYPHSDESGVVIHRFLERLIPFTKPMPNVTSNRPWDFDNFKFIIHELYLYAVTCFINSERFKTAAALMSRGYYLPTDTIGNGSKMKSFTVFYNDLDFLDYRKHRLKSTSLSLHADLLMERSNQSGIDFQHLMQADFVLYLRSLLHRPENQFSEWWPVTLLYSCNYPSVFEIFARSQSAEYFKQVEVLLGIESKNDLIPILTMIQKKPQIVPSWSFQRISPIKLLGFNQISTTI